MCIRQESLKKQVYSNSIYTRGASGRSRNFFLKFWLIFAKMKSRDTLFCMSNQLCWCLWQSQLRKIYDSLYIKWKYIYSITPNQCIITLSDGITACHASLSHVYFSFKQFISSQLYSKVPFLFLLYYQRVTGARLFESILFQAVWYKPPIR